MRGPRRRQGACGSRGKQQGFWIARPPECHSGVRWHRLGLAAWNPAVLARLVTRTPDGLLCDRWSCRVYTLRVEEKALLERITVNPAIFAGKPIIRGRRLAVEHVLGMLAAGDTPETILEGYPWLEPEDIRACLAYAHKLVAHERIEPLVSSDAE